MFIMSSRYTPRFLANIMGNIPIFGYLAKVCQTTFVNTSDDSPDARDKARKTIKEIQEHAENNPNANPLGIFAEGALTNGKHLMPFKRGAFESGLSIRPLVIVYDFTIWNPHTFVPRVFSLFWLG